MNIWYWIFYACAFLLNFGGIGYLIYLIKNKDRSFVLFNKGIDAKVAGFVQNNKQKFENKKSAILIYFAKKGFIKIRQNNDGKIYIDKLASFDAVDVFKDALDNLYSQNVSYHSDENAIMSYETVAWDDVKEEFKTFVGNIVGVKIEEDDNKDIGSTVKKFKMKTVTNILLWMNWIICLLPVSISHAMQETDDKWAVVFAVFFVFGVVFSVGVGIFKLIGLVRAGREYLKYSDNWVAEIFVGLSMLLNGMLWLMLVVDAIFIVALFIVGGEYAFEEGLNAILSFIFLGGTSVIAFIKHKYGKLEFYRKKNAIIEALKSRKMKRVTDDKQNVTSDYASIYRMVEEIKKESAKKEVPEWYEGDNWNGVEELLVTLEKN